MREPDEYEDIREAFSERLDHDDRCLHDRYDREAIARAKHNDDVCKLALGAMGIRQGGL